MSPAEFASSTIERAWEPPEEVVVPYALAFDPVLQPEDYGVLIRLLLRDPGKPAGVAALAKEFQESGWKMGDSRLRGVMSRLKKAGHVNHRQKGYDPATGRPTWAFAVYRNPANNPQYVQAGTDAASQVRPTRWNPTHPGEGQRSDALDSNVYAGQADPLESNASSSDTLDSDASESNVRAGQIDTLESNGWVSSPPHPPEGGGNTSPNPHKSGRAAKWAASCALAPEDYAPTVEEIKTADDFLQELPGKWQMGVDEARALAPLLASRVHVLGLAFDLMLQLQLIQDDPQNPARVPARVMPVRIRALKRRRAGGPGAESAAGGLAEWCGKCNRGEFPMAVYQRTVELADGTDVPCKECHPKYARA
ncbi:hypothetical protein [Streptomyces phaeochromogenes]|uniref:hypothetical protein n=1 Tax=Streptomyces phaeochromogenes TaxID=1923 RepID=UPI00371A8F3C